MKVCSGAAPGCGKGCCGGAIASAAAAPGTGTTGAALRPSLLPRLLALAAAFGGSGPSYAGSASVMPLQVTGLASMHAAPSSCHGTAALRARPVSL